MEKESNGIENHNKKLSKAVNKSTGDYSKKMKIENEWRLPGKYDIRI